MNEILKAFKSIIFTGMPEGPQRPSQIQQGIHQIIRGGAVEQPTPHYPGTAEQLLRGGAPEPPSAPGLFEREAVGIGNQIIQTAHRTLFDGAVEQPDQEAIAKRAAAAETSKEIANTAGHLVWQGILGMFGLAKKGIEHGAKAAANRKKNSTQTTSTQPSTTRQLSAPTEDFVEGEYRVL